MAIGDSSHEDAAADAGSVLAVDDHGLARDAALGFVRAGGEPRDAARGAQARHDVHRRGVAVGSGRVGGALRSRPRVRKLNFCVARGWRTGAVARARARINFCMVSLSAAGRVGLSRRILSRAARHIYHW